MEPAKRKLQQYEHLITVALDIENSIDFLSELLSEQGDLKINSYKVSSLLQIIHFKLKSTLDDIKEDL